jgi:Type II CAAX prenyl endopeptidase Rce1-like
MAVSTMHVRLLRSQRPVPATFTRGALAFAAALGGAEVVYRFIGPFWGATFFAAIFLAIIHLAMFAGSRSAADADELAALLAAASLIPLARLLVVSVPTLPSLRLYPNALWVLPMGLASVYAYRAWWVPATYPRLLSLPSHRWRPLATQAGVVAAGAGLGALGAYAVPYSGPHLLIYPDADKWIGAALFALAGGVGELAWRGVLQRNAADVAGPMGAVACFLVSAYFVLSWMGPAAAPVIALSALTSVVVYRTRYVTGAVAAHTLLNLVLVLLR